MRKQYFMLSNGSFLDMDKIIKTQKSFSGYYALLSDDEKIRLSQEDFKKLNEALSIVNEKL